MTPTLPTSAEARKQIPLAQGLLYYFPAALAKVAELSKIGNDQHNPGQPMHHARGKSSDHADCIMRHLVDAGTVDNDGVRHSTKVAWRALALLQEECEREENAPLPRNARFDAPPARASTWNTIESLAPPETVDGQTVALLPPGSPPNSAGDL